MALTWICDRCRCAAEGTDPPDGWDEFELPTEDANVAGMLLCIPCQNSLLRWREGAG